VTFDGVQLDQLGEEEMRQIRRRIQIIFQDPISSLNERRKVRDLVAEGLQIWNAPKETVHSRVAAVLEAVGLDPAAISDRRPRSFSGGQCQRICIARALILDPELLICDEPVSSLDVSVQAQILNLLEDMKGRYKLTLLFVTHDLGVVKAICDRVIVMYLGRVCEVAGPDDLFSRPAHPYTRLLMASVPQARTKHRDLRPAPDAELPSPVHPPDGCRFNTRCPLVQEQCFHATPEIRELSPGHFVACHFAEKGV
jgi:peptide/nickel transport system ATP-binding protein